MRVSDLLWNDEWLKKFAKDNGDDILKLYLVYNDLKFGLDSAKEIFDRVVGLDFVAEEDSGIIPNEEIRRGRQQGVQHVAPLVPDSEEYHWWIEISLDKDLIELIEVVG